MRIGVAYYPEHWPEDRWPVDARMMAETGVDVVRVGEFAWSRLEPKREQYEFDWLGRAIEALAEADLEVILCTPTAVPPAWLFNRHPSMPAMDREGKPWFPGSRRVICLNNRPYRRYVRRLMRELAKQFGGNPHIVGWQIDNELGGHGSGRCYCDDCQQAFREWLRRRYGTIERLNRLWGTVFWSQEFTDWHLIPAPRRTPGGPHPSLALDYERFTSATIRDFVAEQGGIIRRYSPNPPPITTNCMGLSTDQVDQFSLGQQQDMASYDNYPVGVENLDAIALQLDLTRSVKRKPFWIMEQQAGPTLIRRRRAQPRQGQLRLWSYQAAARGAEFIEYFRWRTCAFAQEMHWYGILDADGSANRRHDEISRTAEELKARAHLWQGRLPRADVAMVLDYHSHWALRADGMASDLNYMAQFRDLYAVLRRMGLAVDIIPPEHEPEGYSALVVPMPVISREDVAGRWQSFVEGGGALLVTAPAGYRTECNTWVMERPPAHMSDLLGARIVEHDVLGAGHGSRVVFDGTEFPLRSYCALMELQDGRAAGVYADEHYDGQPAIVRRESGGGVAWFLGAVATRDLYAPLLRAVLKEAGVEPHPWSSGTLEVVPLRDEGRQELIFVLNHSADPIELPVPDGKEYRDLFAEADHRETVALDGFGVVLLQG